MSVSKIARAHLFAGTGLVAAMAAVPAFAQEASTFTGVEDIIVTAQKREQSLQDVPIAVTALSSDTLQANRVTSVIDLSALAPGLTMRTTAGGSSIPTFGMRGAVGQGVVIGSDKQVSTYLDGVYLANPRGSIFDLPDTERIEVLRGPQGTLFGRNATAGAVSISTREPDGDARVEASGTIGNRDHYRFRLSAETPQVGNFSAYFSYVHDEYRGPIENAGAGQVWDRTSALKYPEYMRSPKWLGSKRSDSYFASVKYESDGGFKLVYKFDYNDSNNTPAGVGFTGYNPDYALAPLFGAIIGTQTDPVYMATDQRRPDIVNNSFSTVSRINQQGHNLTATFALGDNVTVKNIAAFRKSSIVSQSGLSGLDSLEMTLPGLTTYVAYLVAPRIPGFIGGTPEVKQAIIQATVQNLVAAGWLGAPFTFLGATADSRAKQWSDELQVTYDSEFLTATVGGLYFKAKDWVGETGYGTQSFSVATGPFNVVSGPSLHTTESIAAYAQAEVHLTPQLDIVLGGRVTRDDKHGETYYGDVGDFDVIIGDYKKTKFNYLIGANYKPNEDLLLYGKWSTAYVSGGARGPVSFKPENAKSAEFGVKADLLDRRLRANLAVYWAEYKDYQTSQSTTTLGDIIGEIVTDPAVAAALGQFIFPQGDVEAKGFELEVTAAPTRGVSLGGSLSYTDTKFKDIPDFMKLAQDLPVDTPDSEYIPTLRPKWTGTIWGQYSTPPLFGETYLTVRADGVYQSKMYFRSAPEPQFEGQAHSVGAYWLVNGRVALRDIDLGGIKTELALWGKNIFDEDVMSFPIVAAGLSGSAFIDARSYGLDLTVQF